MKKIRIIEAPPSEDIPAAALQELVGKVVPFRGSGSAGGHFTVDAYDLLGVLGDDAPQMKSLLDDNIQHMAGTRFEIEEDVCEVV